MCGEGKGFTLPSLPPPPPGPNSLSGSPRPAQRQHSECVGGTRSTWVMEGVRGEGVRTPSGGKWGLCIGERCGG